jgi:hypothetical protein
VVVEQGDGGFVVVVVALEEALGFWWRVKAIEERVVAGGWREAGG